MLGILPAAGAGSRLQPLAFSKEMLPVGSVVDEHGVERPRAVSEFLVERMLHAGADRLCFVLSPEKTDILAYYARHPAAQRCCYVVQQQPSGLCDALFRALQIMRPDEEVLIGLPDTVWFPVAGYDALTGSDLSLLLFPVDRPEQFDAVVTRDDRVLEVQVKTCQPATRWVWGAVRMPGRVFRQLHAIWSEPDRGDEYIGTLVNEYLRRGGSARGVHAGERYFDVGTLEGYRAAINALRQPLETESESESEKAV